MRLLLACMIVLSFHACKEKESSISEAWIFQKAEFTPGDTDPVVDAINPMNLNTSSFMNLQDDGKYTSYLGRFEQGQWELNSDTLLLVPSGSWLRIPFRVLSNKDGILQLYYAPRQAIYSFRGFPNDSFKSGLDNPFSFTNNKWRFKPEKPESEREITDRLKNHFRFYQHYFSWAEKTGMEQLDVNQVPSPLKIYSNGFELIHYEEQPYEWKQCFYDTADVRKAYLKLYYLFYKEDLDWKEKEHRFRMFASAYEQLQQKLQ